MPAGRPRRTRDRRRALTTALFLAPACVLFATFVLYPIVASVVLSLHEWAGVGPRRFIGLANYRELGTDPVFVHALANNLRWLLCYFVAPLAGLVLALLLQRATRGFAVMRTLFFMPFVISQVVVGLVFGWFFHPSFGLFGHLLRALGLPELSPLDSERWSLYPMIVAGLWPQTAYCMILYLAGLAAIPRESIDAARVDGARGAPLYRYVVLPQLRGVHFLVAMVCAIAALRSFDYVMIMTMGGPHDSSTVLAYYMYEQTFTSLRYGYGAAIAVVLLALMSGIILVLLTRMFRRETA